MTITLISLELSIILVCEYLANFTELYLCLLLKLLQFTAIKCCDPLNSDHVNICRKISFWVSGQDDQTPLHISSRLGKQDIVQLLLTNGADPDNGYTPLHIAAKKNQMEISTTLLEYGALTNTVTRQGITPLHLAAQEGSVDIVTLLLARGSPINAGNKVE
uniref:Uncharacterized protein n=1 Tax=Oryzias latipes TaxID=8090 RepID=A0A3B3HQF5_ORYLA